MFDKKLLQQMIDEKYVSKRKHPEVDLFIYNYTAKAQYDWVWNDVTEQCRGLIMDAQDNVIARPFRKFYNLDAETKLPLVPFEVTDKLDGSLGILYWVGDEPFIATRGSFESEQAIKAKEIFDAKYRHVIPKLDRNITYLFEILFPANRIVVDYGGREDLVLLALRETATGKELPLVDIGFPVVKTFVGVKDVLQLSKQVTDNAEGFVVRFANDLRLKIKFEEYKRLHRLVTQVSNVVIWEYLKDGLSFDELIERVPDEFYDWLSKTKQGILDAYSEIENECIADFATRPDSDDRKENAMYFQTKKYQSVLFAMLDGKDYSHIGPGRKPV